MHCPPAGQPHRTKQRARAISYDRVTGTVGHTKYQRLELLQVEDTDSLAEFWTITL